MKKLVSICILPAFSLALLLGCDSDKNTASPSVDQNSAVNSDTVTARITVMTDGTVYLNSEAVEIDSLASKLDELGEISTIWYHREAPEAAEPHANAMKAIAVIADRQLPIVMYLDKDFTKPLTIDELDSSN